MTVAWSGAGAAGIGKGPGYRTVHTHLSNFVFLWSFSYKIGVHLKVYHYSLNLKCV